MASGWQQMSIDNIEWMETNNDSYGRLQCGPMNFVGGQRVPPWISIEFQWLSL